VALVETTYHLLTEPVTFTKDPDHHFDNLLFSVPLIYPIAIDFGQGSFEGDIAAFRTNKELITDVLYYEFHIYSTDDGTGGELGYITINSSTKLFEISHPSSVVSSPSPLITGIFTDYAGYYGDRGIFGVFGNVIWDIAYQSTTITITKVDLFVVTGTPNIPPLGWIDVTDSILWNVGCGDGQDVPPWPGIDLSYISHNPTPMNPAGWYWDGAEDAGISIFTPNGTWINGLRPTKIRFTHNGNCGAFYLYSDSYAVKSSSRNLSYFSISEEFNINVNADIDALTFYFGTTGATLFKIELYTTDVEQDPNLDTNWIDVTEYFSGTFSYGCDLTLANTNPIDWTLVYSGLIVPEAIRINCMLSPYVGETAFFVMAGFLISNLSNELTTISLDQVSFVDVVSPVDYPTNKIELTTGEYVSNIHFNVYLCEGWQWDPVTDVTITITKIEFHLSNIPDFIRQSKLFKLTSQSTQLVWIPDPLDYIQNAPGGGGGGSGDVGGGGGGGSVPPPQGVDTYTFNNDFPHSMGSSPNPTSPPSVSPVGRGGSSSGGDGGEGGDGENPDGSYGGGYYTTQPDSHNPGQGPRTVYIPYMPPGVSGVQTS